jgi:hypothetical protein
LQNIKTQFNLRGRTKKGSVLQCWSNTQRQKCIRTKKIEEAIDSFRDQNEKGLSVTVFEQHPRAKVHKNEEDRGSHRQLSRSDRRETIKIFGKRQNYSILHLNVGLHYSTECYYSTTLQNSNVSFFYVAIKTRLHSCN